MLANTHHHPYRSHTTYLSTHLRPSCWPPWLVLGLALAGTPGSRGLRARLLPSESLERIGSLSEFDQLLPGETRRKGESKANFVYAQCPEGLVLRAWQRWHSPGTAGIATGGGHGDGSSTCHAAAAVDGRLPRFRRRRVWFPHTQRGGGPLFLLGGPNFVAWCA